MRIGMRWTVVAALALVGCGPLMSARPVRGPDGTPHFVAHCGTVMSICYEQAQGACPSGYDVVQLSQGQADTVRDMLIKCKPAPVAAATPRP